MKRTPFIIGSLVVAVLTLVALMPVSAAPTVPSWEILSVDASNDCQNGIVWIDSFVNHNGTGSAYGWIGRDGVGGEGGYGMVDFSLIPSGPYLTQINIPGSYPENTVFYIELTTYSGADKQGDATFYSKIYFNCTTGEQVGDVVNHAYVQRANIDIPVDGPTFEHPGDIVSVNTTPVEVEFEIQMQLSEANHIESSRSALLLPAVQSARVARGG